MNVRHRFHTNCGVLSAFSGPLSVLETSSDESKELYFRIMEICLYQSCAGFLQSFDILLVSHYTAAHSGNCLSSYLLSWLI